MFWVMAMAIALLLCRWGKCVCCSLPEAQYRARVGSQVTVGSSPVTEMTPPFTYTVRVLGPPVGSNRPQSHMRDPAKEMGVRRRQLYANRGESLQGSEERVFWVGSQQRQDHGCKPGAEGGWE